MALVLVYLWRSMYLIDIFIHRNRFLLLSSFLSSVLLLFSSSVIYLFELFINCVVILRGKPMCQYKILYFFYDYKISFLYLGYNFIEDFNFNLNRY